MSVLDNMLLLQLRAPKQELLKPIDHESMVFELRRTSWSAMFSKKYGFSDCTSQFSVLHAAPQKTPLTASMIEGPALVLSALTWCGASPLTCKLTPGNVLPLLACMRAVYFTACLHIQVADSPHDCGGHDKDDAGLAVELRPSTLPCSVIVHRDSHISCFTSSLSVFRPGKVFHSSLSAKGPQQHGKIL